MRYQKKYLITNDFMFCKVMENEEICRDFLQTILPNLSIGHLNYLEKQKVIDHSFHHHGIRLDVFSKDKNHVYDIEMQCINVDDLPKRSRYYQGLIDTELLKRGQHYKNLRNSYVIFICTFDPFDREHIIYHFENTCKEEPNLYLNDGAEKIFINTKGIKGEISDDFKALIDYFENRPGSQIDLIKKINQAVENANKDPYWRKKMGTLEMRFKDYEEFGRKNEKKQIAQKLLVAGNSIDFIAQLTELSKEEILTIKEASTV